MKKIRNFAEPVLPMQSRGKQIGTRKFPIFSPARVAWFSPFSV